jgi:hypothetical protein
MTIGLLPKPFEIDFLPPNRDGGIGNDAQSDDAALIPKDPNADISDKNRFSHASCNDQH